MALPQSIDPITLNISGRPEISTVTPTQITSVGATGMPNPTIENVNRSVNPLLGALFGGLLGYATRENLGLPGSTTRPTTSGGGTQGGGGLGGGGGSGGSRPSSSVGTPTGNIGSLPNYLVPQDIPLSQAQDWLNSTYGTTNGQPNVVVSGTNMSTGQAVGLPNYNIGPNFGGNTSTAGSSGMGVDATLPSGISIDDETTTTPTATPIANQYFQDSQGNIYDATGTLIYINPSNSISGGTTSGGISLGDTSSGGTSLQYLQDSQGNVYDENGTLIYYNPSTPILGTNDGGGGYDPNVPDTDQFYEDSYGNIFDYAGNLVLEYGNGYYYEPDTGNFYDSNFDVVGDDFSAYQDFFGIPTYDSSAYDDYDFSDLFDYGNYTSGSTTYIKDGGSVRSGLATPLFRQGGSVPKFEDGGFIDQVVANQMPQSVSTTMDEPVAMTTTSVNQPMATSGLQDTSSNPLTSNFLGSILDTVLGTARQNPIMTGAGLGALLTAALNSGAIAIPTNRGVNMTALGTLRPRTTTVGPARYVPYSQYGTPTTPYDYSQLYANLGVSPFGAGAGALSPSATSMTSASAQPTTAQTTIPSPSASYYSYGSDVNPAQVLSSKIRLSGLNNPLLSGLSMTPTRPYRLAEGGSSHGNSNIPTTASESHNPNVPIIQGRQDYRQGAYVQGAGDGQSDDIPAMLADGEYVIDAETVSQLGNGSNKAGAKMLDDFRKNIRSHKRSAPSHKIPPKSKSPLAYLKGAK